jgi:tetratricopeptide (TPR) repeat protein
MHDRQADELIADFAALPAHASQERARVVRRLLTLPAAQTTLAWLSQDASRRGVVFDIARVDIEDQLDGAWVYAAERWMLLIRPSWQERAQFCSDLAWFARQRGSSVLKQVTVGRALSTLGAAEVLRTRRCLYALALRYDFRCRALEAFFSAHHSSPDEWDPFTRALHAFALLGQSDTAGMELIDPVLRDAQDDAKVAHTLLHGVWLGDSLPDQPRLLLDLLAGPAFGERPDPLALFRKAQALRRLGRFEEALRAIDDAFESLPADVDPAVHSDLVRERVLVTVARDLAGGGSSDARDALVGRPHG